MRNFENWETQLAIDYCKTISITCILIETTHISCQCLVCIMLISTNIGCVIKFWSEPIVDSTQYILLGGIAKKGPRISPYGQHNLSIDRLVMPHIDGYLGEACLIVAKALIMNEIDFPPSAFNQVETGGHRIIIY